MRNILVTGGAGFIGSNFIRYLLKNDPKVNIINLDVLTYAGNLENLRNLTNSQNHTFIKGDIRDTELLFTLFRKYKFDTIVHFAAESHVDRSISKPDLFVQTNIIGTFNLLEVARSIWFNEPNLNNGKVNFHHVSTDEVFGSLTSNECAWTENSPYKPNSPYSASKASSDHLVRAIGHTYKFPYTISHSSNNYGPYQHPEKLIPKIILNCLENKFIPVYGDGMQIRDWLHVEDHCKAIHLILKNGTVGNAYNIGGTNQYTNIDIVKTICDELEEIKPNDKVGSYRNLIKFVDDRPGHDRRYELNSKKIQSELNWHPQKSLKKGIRETIEWYINQKKWVSTILNSKKNINGE